jgi:hypothetical protein
MAEFEGRGSINPRRDIRLRRGPLIRRAGQKESNCQSGLLAVKPVGASRCCTLAPLAIQVNGGFSNSVSPRSYGLLLIAVTAM